VKIKDKKVPPESLTRSQGSRDGETNCATLRKLSFTRRAGRGNKGRERVSNWKGQKTKKGTTAESLNLLQSKTVKIDEIEPDYAKVFAIGKEKVGTNNWKV